MPFLSVPFSPFKLVHVGQHERLGRAVFLWRYIIEMEMMGYSGPPLELERRIENNVLFGDRA